MRMPTLETDRLSLRPWTLADLADLQALCSDPEVMKHFPHTLNEAETKAFLKRLMDQYEKHGYTYFRAERKDTNAFIGFVGLAYQDYESPFAPAVDIGWRLLPTAWGNGFASEGARFCLNYAFEVLKLDRVVAVCTIRNANSERVMQRIGMTKQGRFMHPALDAHPEVQELWWYAVSR